MPTFRMFYMITATGNYSVDIEAENKLAAEIGFNALDEDEMIQELKDQKPDELGIEVHLTEIEESFICPACQEEHLDYGERTVYDDHGVCYSCNKEMLNGERCRYCFRPGHSMHHCPDVQDERTKYTEPYDPLSETLSSTQRNE